MSQLSLKEEDLILLDRASRMDFARPLLEKVAPSKLAMVFHSEHEFENGHLNYEYYYVFKYAKRFDYFITATDLQKKSWSKHFINKDAKEFQSIAFQ